MRQRLYTGKTAAEGCTENSFRTMQGATRTRVPELRVDSTQCGSSHRSSSPNIEKLIRDSTSHRPRFRHARLSPRNVHSTSVSLEPCPIDRTQKATTPRPHVTSRRLRAFSRAPKSRSEAELYEHLLLRRTSQPMASAVTFGSDPKIRITVDRSIPSAYSPYSTQTALEQGIYSSYFLTQSCPDIILDDNHSTSRVRPTAGLVEDIVEWTSFFPGSDIVRNYLTAFRNSFCPSDVFQAVERLHEAYTSKGQWDEQAQERHYAFLVQWILYWGIDFTNATLREQLVTHVQQFYKKGLHAVDYVRLLIDSPDLGSKPGVAHITQPFMAKLKKRPSFTSGHRDLSFHGMIGFDADSIAQQLTMIECSLLQDVTVPALLKKCKGVSSSCLEELSTHFNRVSLWVATGVLTRKSEKKQIRFWRKMLRIAKRLYQLRNYSACAQIISGLQNISITRLKLEIPEKSMKGLHHLSDLLSPAENYSTYRRLLKRPPCIPLLPVCLRDLTFIQDGNSDFLEDKDVRVINVEKWHQIATTIYELNIHESPFYSYPVDLDCKDSILYTLAQAQDADQLYELSLQQRPLVTSPRALGTSRD